jgi:hypothetical protein
MSGECRRGRDSIEGREGDKRKIREEKKRREKMGKIRKVEEE